MEHCLDMIFVRVHLVYSWNEAESGRGRRKGRKRLRERAVVTAIGRTAGKDSVKHVSWRQC